MNDEDVNPPLTAALEDLVVAVLGLRRAVIRRMGITETELRALDLVSRAPSSPGEIARHLQVTTAASTGVVDRLARHGHVERRPHPTDRRRQEVHLTEQGSVEMHHQLAPMLVALAHLEESLTADERATALRVMAGMLHAFDLVIHADD